VGTVAVWPKPPVGWPIKAAFVHSATSAQTQAAQRWERDNPAHVALCGSVRRAEHLVSNVCRLPSEQLRLETSGLSGCSLHASELGLVEHRQCACIPRNCLRLNQGRRQQTQERKPTTLFRLRSPQTGNVWKW
jgi:hypothetical protein